ncbi:MAG: hypothetical protein R2788_26855 [Saprospiraceae bacterium]
MNPSSNLLTKGLITTFGLSFFLLFLGKTTAQPTGFTDQLFMGGWDEVSGFVWDANGRMYVWERDGGLDRGERRQINQPAARHQR